MGGVGSGDWDRHNRKLTVEQSLTLKMQDFGRLISTLSSGTLFWTQNGREIFTIGYRVAPDDLRTVILQYRWRDMEDVQIPIHLQTTPTQFGGRRRWFTCPLTRDDVPCNRRCGNLHLPLRAKYFGCRICHDLTYRSCQVAHQQERLPDSIDRFCKAFAAGKLK